MLIGVASFVILLVVIAGVVAYFVLKNSGGGASGVRETGAVTVRLFFSSSKCVMRAVSMQTLIG